MTCALQEPGKPSRPAQWGARHRERTGGGSGVVARLHSTPPSPCAQHAARSTHLLQTGGSLVGQYSGMDQVLRSGGWRLGRAGGVGGWHEAQHEPPMMFDPSLSIAAQLASCPATRPAAHLHRGKGINLQHSDFCRGLRRYPRRRCSRLRGGRGRQLGHRGRRCGSGLACATAGMKDVQALVVPAA